MEKVSARTSTLIIFKLALSFLLTLAFFPACGGSSSETAMPLEPLPEEAKQEAKLQKLPGEKSQNGEAQKAPLKANP